MAKNPFKKKSLMDTLVNVGIGGAANVLYDQVLGSSIESSLKKSNENSTNEEESSTNPATVNNIIKIVGGAVIGGMISNRYGRAAADGIATVGVSNLISGLMGSSTETGGDNSGETTTTTTTATKTEGLPGGTVGRILLGNRKYKKRGTNGLGNIYGAD